MMWIGEFPNNPREAWPSAPVCRPRVLGGKQAAREAEAPVPRADQDLDFA
jgi:hypothetical protein